MQRETESSANGIAVEIEHEIHYSKGHERDQDAGVPPAEGCENTYTMNTYMSIHGRATAPMASGGQESRRKRRRRSRREIGLKRCLEPASW